MGKSLGNAVSPLDLAQVFGVDAFRYLLMREMAPGYDADFDPQRFSARYQADLANNLGNLLQRVTAMPSRESSVNDGQLQMSAATFHSSSRSFAAAFAASSGVSCVVFSGLVLNALAVVRLSLLAEINSQ